MASARPDKIDSLNADHLTDEGPSPIDGRLKRSLVVYLVYGTLTVVTVTQGVERPGNGQSPLHGTKGIQWITRSICKYLLGRN